jgi:hypothetical protein
MKRYKKSSLVPKKAKYILAKEFDMNPNTFSSLLKACMEAGYITEEEKCYKIASFREILKDVFAGSGVYFGRHDILDQPSKSYKEILTDFMELLVVDNVIAQQQKQIDKKQLSELFWRMSEGTDKKARTEWFELPYRARSRVSRQCLKSVRTDRQNSSAVVSSARHTAKKIGISAMKANKILNNASKFTREIKVKWVFGANSARFDHLRELYPSARIVPVLSLNMLKVCFGSELALSM